MKKLLTLGIVFLFMGLLFIPQTTAIEEEDPQAPISTQKYGIALIEGIVENPKTINPFINGIFQLLNISLKFGFYGDFIEGTIKPRFAIFKLRQINIPDGFDVAEIHGSLCKFNEYTKIDNTHYYVNGTIFNLRADLY